MSTDKTRITFDYKSYHCISCFFKNKFQGVAKIHDDIIYKIEGNSIDDVKNLLINCIDEESEEDTREIFEKFHKKYIASLKNNTDISFEIRKSTKKNIRVTHCWKCKKYLDNKIYYECCECDGILCRCGACFCGTVWRR
tara:strand:+ start:145 stop:561 length:417 start_codon:yes stop_codon:yes gene_type:complete